MKPFARSRILITSVAAVTVLTFVGIGSAVAAPRQPNVSELRIDVGGNGVIDSNGKTWSRDSGFVGGTRTTTSALIGKVDEHGLMQSVRTGMDGYRLPVSNGRYILKLYFVTDSTQQALFTVTAEGTPVRDHRDTADVVDSNPIDIKQSTIHVRDGELNLDFTGDEASLAAIELSTTTRSSTPRFATEGEPFVQPPWTQRFLPRFVIPIPDDTKRCRLSMPFIDGYRVTEHPDFVKPVHMDQECRWVDGNGRPILG